MAIQPVDLGAPVTGLGGDDYRQAHTKINANFVEVGADIVALKAKDATQDTAINLKAVKTEVTTALGLKANVSDVNAKNTTQDSAINLRATISSVDAKNATQDAAITAAQNKADAAVPKAEKGAPNGVATLDADGKISPLQIPTEQPIAWGNITGDIADQTDLVSSIPDLAKTTLTYTTTTTEMPNLTVDINGTLKRSTQVLGTAATKNVGAAVAPFRQEGNTGELVDWRGGSIGGYGLGGVADIIGNIRGIWLNSKDTSTGFYFAPTDYYNNSESVAGAGANLPSQDNHAVIVVNTDKSRHQQLQIACNFQGGTSNLHFRTFNSAPSGGAWAKIYSDKNTTIVNGSLKPSSPVVKIHTDSLELNDDAERMGVTLNKRGVGDYLLQNTTGLRNDGGWRIELPQDVNGNPYFAIDYNELENNDIEVKTYRRIFDMNTFMFGPDLDNPVDIKEGSSIAIRFNDLPLDDLDDTQMEV